MSFVIFHDLKKNLMPRGAVVDACHFGGCGAPYSSISGMGNFWR